MSRRFPANWDRGPNNQHIPRRILNNASSMENVNNDNDNFRRWSRRLPNSHNPRGNLSNASSMESVNVRDNELRHNWRGQGQGSNSNGFRGRRPDHFRSNRLPNTDSRPDGRPDGRPRVGFFGFKKLEELLTKNPEEALMTFLSNIEKVDNYLKSVEISPDSIVLVVEVLANVIKSVFAESVAQLLLAIFRINFFEPMKSYIMQLPLADSAKKNKGRRFWNDPEQFFLNVALILDAFVEVVPTTALDIAPEIVKAVLYTQPNLETDHRLVFSNEMGIAYEDLQLKLLQLVEKKDKKKKQKENLDYTEKEEPPPNDFHDIDVYPTALEITTRTSNYLRKNVIKGAYQDVHHYLDVQYRLLREDFVAPLRDGICEYFEMIKDGRKQKLSNIKIYKDVLCLGVVPNVNQVGYLVQAFKPKSIRNLEHTKRFMFGSLVCLTPDNFTTIIFGKIIDRDMKYLNIGRLVLGFDVGVELDINRMYDMVECSIYFEPYYQVLTALKQMDEQRFPLKEYLVEVRTESELPGYLPAGSHVDLGHETDSLNPSQLAAYEAAMMSKFCIVQGPPGTGKTYLALKMARDLLERKKNWMKAPMLVICYTNHALDQFLEGLLPYTQNLVRVGGQCKNENLKNFNLRNLRVKNVPGDYFNAQRASKFEVANCSRGLSMYGSILQAINEYTSVLRFSSFNRFDVDPEFGGSWFARAKPTELLEWLLYQPNNGNEVKFADYEAVTQMIEKLNIEDNQNANVEDDDTTDDPLNGQIKQNQLDIDRDEDLQIRYDVEQKDLFNVRKAEENMHELAKEMNRLSAVGLENTIDYLTAMRKMIKLRIDYDYVCQKLRMLRQQEGEATIYVDYENPTYMPANDRWLLYGNWVRRYKNLIMDLYLQKDVEYRQLYAKFTEVKDMLDLYKLKNVDVIGMTTTGAARLHKTLQALGCPIVIVEEAAEVLEAHITTALSPQCEHLILIGDHKQLKPSTADYTITRDYNLGVSLFERMVMNGLHCHTLDVQHRMRPEIANLVCPSIYKVLHNHDSVKLYPDVRGIDAPLYFVTHDHRETESQDRSKENQFEAEYLILLARYLTLNNYDASRITIIAAYSGQWFVLRALKKRYHILRDMRICILDNFQGEENDIILLSLVRNNEAGKNGFLNLENRICVALSRAKHGMYILGNMPQLCNGSPIWREVSTVLEKYDALGPYLTVRCVNHPDNVTHLRDTADFDKVPEGGCLKICAKGLACGHKCAKLCHSTSHDTYKCHQPCTKVLCEFGHICPDKCFVECDKCKVPKFSALPCGHSRDIPCYQLPEEVLCDVKVPTTLPCGHQAEKPCHADPISFRCPHPCEARVEPCGHSCSMLCHVRKDPNHEKYMCRKQCVNSNNGCTMPDEFKHPCQKRCFETCDVCCVEVKKRRSCDHYYDVPCHADVEDVQCKRPCKRKLLCEHNCTNICKDPCGPCKVKVPKIISECGHTIQWECGKQPDKSNCKNKACPAILDCGHPCPLPCKQKCSTAVCKILVPVMLNAPCGHVPKVPCYMRSETVITNELLSFCTAKCSAVLECAHTCPGTCGQCAQGRFHVACAEKCDKTLICGHGCVTPCVENCKPCTLPCQYKCEHSGCTKQCGVPCTPCSEQCNRNCPHQRCSRTCGEICDVQPCKEPCPKLLDCLHECIGFCGDVCPPLCRICDKNEVTEVFFGTEDEEDARFVYLAHCNHTLESSGLDRCFGADEDNDVQEVKIPRCPKCTANVQVPRYRDYIKAAHKNVEQIKQRYFGGHPRELTELNRALKKDIQDAKKVYGEHVCTKVLEFFEDKIKITNKKNQRQDHSKSNLISLRARVKIFLELATIRYGVTMPNYIPLSSPKVKQLVDDYLSFLFGKLISPDVSINQYQIQEFQIEVLRFNRIMNLARAMIMNPAVEKLKEYEPCYRLIFTFEMYDATQDTLVKSALEALNKAANNGLAITEIERREIVAAIGLSPGHWFKCAKGHIYAIGECGGAMEEAKCPECGLTIGGTSHTLTSGNTLASEMDGARRPAYPTINNMAMYRL